MKKATLTLLALGAVSSASAANYVGGSIGSGLSLHYQSDLTSTSAIRYGLNLDAINFNFSALSVNASVDYLADFAAAGGTLGGFTPYYGVGLGAGAGLGANLGLSVYPHATLGLRYNISAPLNVFVEGNAGPYIRVGSGANTTNIGFGSTARVGLNYRLP